MVKRTSLLHKSVNYGLKSFIRLVPVGWIFRCLSCGFPRRPAVNVLKLFSSSPILSENKLECCVSAFIFASMAGVCIRKSILNMLSQNFLKQKIQNFVSFFLIFYAKLHNSFSECFMNAKFLNKWYKNGLKIHFLEFL
jgi:hypothetical protein